MIEQEREKRREISPILRIWKVSGRDTLGGRTVTASEWREGMMRGRKTEMRNDADMSR